MSSQEMKKELQVINSADDDEGLKLTVNEEFKDFITALSEAEYSLLEQSIRQDGLRDKIVVYQRSNGEYVIVDGHHRYEICKKIGIKITEEELFIKTFDEERDIYDWMYANQIGRRNLRTAQKCRLVMKYKDVYKNIGKWKMACGAKGWDESSQPSWNTTEELAKKAHVGEQTLKRYIRLIGEVDDETKEKLHNGEISINAAYNNLFHPEKNDQDESDFNKEEAHEDEEQIIDLVGNEEGSASETTGKAHKCPEKAINVAVSQDRAAMQYQVVENEKAMRKRILKNNDGTVIPVIKSHNQSNLQYIVFENEIIGALNFLALPFTEIDDWANRFFSNEPVEEYREEIWKDNIFPNGRYPFRIQKIDYDRKDFDLNDVHRDDYYVRLVVIRGKYKGFRATFHVAINDGRDNQRAVRCLTSLITACKLNEKVKKVNELRNGMKRILFNGKELMASKITKLQIVDYGEWQLIDESFVEEEYNLDDVDELSEFGDNHDDPENEQADDEFELG